MPRVVYVNGRYLPYSKALVHAEDRGFQFADAVYEVCEIKDCRFVDQSRHLARLRRSLAEIEIIFPLSDAALRQIMHETMARNRVGNGTLYLQVTRGSAPRDFSYPACSVRPTIVCLARASSLRQMRDLAEAGIGVRTMPDCRWRRCDIKTVMLLPAVLAKAIARRHGAREAWFVDDDGFVTEGASSNAWIVVTDGTLVTRPLSPAILPGVTRATLIDALKGEGLRLEERRFSVSEAKSAAEAFVTSASGTVMPVVTIDGQSIGNGRPGPITRLLHSKFHDYAEVAKP